MRTRLGTVVGDRECCAGTGCAHAHAPNRLGAGDVQSVLLVEVTRVSLVLLFFFPPSSRLENLPRKLLSETIHARKLGSLCKVNKTQAVKVSEVKE